MYTLFTTICPGFSYNCLADKKKNEERRHEYSKHLAINAKIIANRVSKLYGPLSRIHPGIVRNKLQRSTWCILDFG